MWDSAIYNKALQFFLTRPDDPIAERIAWLLLYVGEVPLYGSVCTYNRVIEVILTQRIKFERSNVIKRRLSAEMGCREFSPSQLLEKAASDRDALLSTGVEAHVLDICIRVTERVQEILGGEERELSLREVESLVSVRGFSVWSVNVVCINATFSPRLEDHPYNALTTRDPVVKRGFYWLTGIPPYDAVLNQLTAEYAPYAGVITRYLWEAFNYNRIAVKLPSSYRKWWNKGAELSKPFPRVDSQFTVAQKKRSVGSTSS